MNMWELWDKLGKNHNQISIIIAIFAMISWKASRNTLCKIIKMICEWFKKLWYNIKQLIKNLRSKIINKLREIVVGKENLELLKELETLRDNKWAIKFLKEFKTGNEVSLTYEALMTFVSVYNSKLFNISTREYSLNELKNSYGEDRKTGFGSQNSIIELRKRTLKKLIDDIVWRTDNNY